MVKTKEYEVRVVLTVRYAASCRPESIGRANSLVGAMQRMGDVLWERGIDLLWEAELPHLVERERHVRVDALADPSADPALPPIAIQG